MFSGRTKIIEKKEIAEKTWEMKFEKPPGFSFKAGQYIWVVVPELTYADPRGNRRAYSITSPQSQKDSLSIILRDTGSGYKKSLLSLAIGSEINLIGSFGSEFVLEDVKAPEVVIIAGGTGITPFLGYLLSDADVKITGHITIIYLNSTPERAFFVKELTAGAGKNNYSFINKTSGHFAWEDIPIGLNIEQTLFYISGLPGMIDQVVPVLLEHNIKRDVMHFERSYPHSPNNFMPADVEKFLSDKDNLGLMAIQQSNQHIVITDENGVALYANEAAQKITGYTLEEMKDNTPRLWGGLMSPEFYRDLWAKKIKGESFSGQITNRRKNGEIYYVQSQISPIIGKDRQVVGFIATEEDITELNEKVNELERSNKLMVDRELKMVALKAEVEDLKKRLEEHA